LAEAAATAAIYRNLSGLGLSARRGRDQLRQVQGGTPKINRREIRLD